MSSTGLHLAVSILTKRENSYHHLSDFDQTLGESDSQASMRSLPLTPGSE